MVREANVKQATAEKQLKEAQGKVSRGLRRGVGGPWGQPVLTPRRSMLVSRVEAAKATNEKWAHISTGNPDTGVQHVTAGLPTTMGIT